MSIAGKEGKGVEIDTPHSFTCISPSSPFHLSGDTERERGTHTERLFNAKDKGEGRG